MENTSAIQTISQAHFIRQFVEPLDLRILSKDLGAKIRDLQSGHSVSLGRVSLASLSRDKDSLDCDEVCAQIERNRTLAEALGITSPVLDPLESPLPKYPSTLLDQAR